MEPLPRVDQAVRTQDLDVTLSQIGVEDEIRREGLMYPLPISIRDPTIWRKTSKAVNYRKL